MNPQGVIQAAQEYEDAIEWAKKLRQAKNPLDYQHAWRKALVAMDTIYNKLGAATAGDPFDEDWMARKRQIRKDDPLLNYLDHARDDAMHGLDDLVNWDDGEIRLIGKVSVDGVELENPVVPMGRTAPTVYLKPHQEVPVELIRRSGLHLVDIFHKRAKVTYKVPDSHMGQVLFQPDPVQVLQLALNFLRDLIGEAQARV